MYNFTLKQFRYFEALARLGNFGRAADFCAISQPALSMQIKDLEDKIGTPLFERGPKKIILTSFGEEFGKHVRMIMRPVDDLENLVRASKNKLIGQMRIGVIPTIAPYLLPAIINNLNDLHPELDIHVRESQTSVLVKELADGRIDTAILALPISDPAFYEAELFSEPFVLIRHSKDRAKPVPDGGSLREMRLLLLEEGHCFRDQALSFCHMQSTTPRDGLDASSLSTLVQMVGAGIGVTLIPEMAIAIETKSASVCVAHFDDPQPIRRVGMIWRKTNPLSKQISQVFEAVRDAATSQGAPYSA